MGENYITCQAEKGSINISEEVITSVVKSAIGDSSPSFQSVPALRKKIKEPAAFTADSSLS